MINFHHHHHQAVNHWGVYNLDKADNLPQQGYFSLGYHPWWLAEQYNWQCFVKKVKQSIEHPNFYAWGEIGLDRSCSIPLEKQFKLWDQLQELILGYPPRPVILHCVGAYADFLSLLKPFKNFALIFHDYRGNTQLTEQFLRKYPNLCFSFGPEILKNDQKYRQTIELLALEKLFLETDEKKMECLSDLYHCVAQIKGIKKETLVQTILENFKKKAPHSPSPEVSEGPKI